MLSTRIDMVNARVKQLLAQAATFRNVTIPPVTTRFDLKGAAAGMACKKFESYSLRFNIDMMTNESWDHLYNNTIPHEVAHTVCQANPHYGKNHNAGWQRVCRALGGKADRCHSEPVIYAKGKTYIYTSSIGSTIHLSSIRHRKVQGGGSYTLRDGGRVTMTSHYTLA